MVAAQLFCVSQEQDRKAQVYKLYSSIFKRRYWLN